MDAISMKLIELAGVASGETYTAENNPLDSDALALRLAVKLGMGTLYETQDPVDGRFVEVSYDIDEDEGTCKVATELLGDDPNAAVRRAIVRAAAEIGKDKP